MALCRRNYNASYLTDIGATGTNGRLTRRNGKLLRRSQFDVSVHSECFAPGYIPIPTYTRGTDQNGRPTCTPGPWSLWSPSIGNDVRDQSFPQEVYPGDLHGGGTAFTGTILAHWNVSQDFDGSFGQHDQVRFTFDSWVQLAYVNQPRWTGAPIRPPASVPDWFWAAKVFGLLDFSYEYTFAGGDTDTHGNPTGYYWDTERNEYRRVFGFTTHATPGPHVVWSAWLYGPREQHRIRATGLEIYGSVVDYTCDLDMHGDYPSYDQGAALLDTWLRNEVAGIYLKLTTSNAHAT